jgi:hypothetical protein
MTERITSVCPLLMVNADTLDDARCIEKACAWYACEWVSETEDGLHVEWSCSIATIAKSINNMERRKREINP